MQELSWDAALQQRLLRASLLVVGDVMLPTSETRNSQRPEPQPADARVPQADAQLSQKREMPQAMPDEEAERRFTRRPRYGLHSTADSEPRADAAETAEMVLKSYGCCRSSD